MAPAPLDDARARTPPCALIAVGGTELDREGEEGSALGADEQLAVGDRRVGERARR